MTSTFSTSLRLELMATGDESGTWGDTTNINLGTLLEQAITGVLSVAEGDTTLTLTTVNGGSDQARNAVVNLTGAMTAARNVVVQTANKLYLIKNSTTGGFKVTVKTAAGTGVDVAAGTSRWLYSDGTNVVDGLVGTLASQLSSAVSISGGTLTGVTVSSSTLSSNTITGGTVASLGTPIASDSGGTGNGFTKFTGPTTSEKTFTLPNASTTILTTGVTATITKGYTLTPNSLGNMTNFTIDPSLGNYQYGTNHAAFTLTAPASDCAIDLLVTNDATAGAITFSGFTVGANTGSALTNTNTYKFIVSIRRINSISTYSIYALQ